MVAFGDVHHLHDFLDGDALVGVDGERGVFFGLEKLHQPVFDLLEGEGRLVSVDVEGVPVFDVTRKKMSRRNTMSVMLDIDMLGSAFVILLSAIILLLWRRLPVLPGDP